MYSRYIESSWQLGLDYETQLSYDQVRKKGFIVRRGAEAMVDHISFISDNSIWTVRADDMDNCEAKR